MRTSVQSVAVSGICLLLGAAACSDNPEISARGLTVSKRQLIPLACSTVPVHEARANADWYWQPEEQEPTPRWGISAADVAARRDGTLLVLDARGSRAVLIDSGNPVRVFGSRGEGPGEFVDPVAVADGFGDDFFVATNDGRVSRFSLTGGVKKSFKLRVGGRVSDLVAVGPNSLAVAFDVQPHEGTTDYVVLVDTLGRVIRTVLTFARQDDAKRPFLGRETNPVRLSVNGVSRHFAVWFPLDNYILLFDDQGNRKQKIEGCLPNEVWSYYKSSWQLASSTQVHVPLTLGVYWGSDGDISVASYHMAGQTEAVRLRRYSRDARENVAADLALTPARTVKGITDITFLNDSILLAFSSLIPETGIKRLVLLGGR